MTSPNDSLPGDTRHGKTTGVADPGAAEIDRIVDELRASAAEAPIERVGGQERAGTDIELTDAALGAANVAAVGGDVVVRPGLLAPVRRRAKRLIHHEVRSQLNPLTAEVARLSMELERRDRLRVAETAEREATVSELRRELAAVKDRLRRAERAPSNDQQSRRTPPQAESGATVSAQPVELDYFAFEGLLRGSIDEIAERQAVYVPLFAEVDDILDIGCGRGELIELLVTAGKRASGVDLDRDMVASCRERGLQVVAADGIADLATRDPQSLGGIAAMQVVEHLRPAQLTAFLDGCHRTLRSGGVLLLETINPVTLSALRNYFADLTHAQPLVPETLKFLVESTGFRDVTITYHNPLPEIARLRHVPYGDRATEDAQAASDRNVDLVNATLFGPQDYAVIARA